MQLYVEGVVGMFSCMEIIHSLPFYQTKGKLHLSTRSKKSCLLSVLMQKTQNEPLSTVHVKLLVVMWCTSGSPPTPLHLKYVGGVLLETFGNLQKS